MTTGKNDVFLFRNFSQNLTFLGTFNFECGLVFRLVLRCRQLARESFARLRSDVLVKLELFDNKHGENPFQLFLCIKYLTSYLPYIYIYIQCWKNVFGHLVERNFIDSETHPSCVRNLVEYFKIHIVYVYLL